MHHEDLETKRRGSDRIPVRLRGDLSQLVLHTYIAMFEGDVFWDVPAGKYFTEPVRWAAEQGIAKGVSQLRFQPDGECTRAQIMTFLCTLK